MDDAQAKDAALPPKQVVAALERRARRSVSPCGEGELVWRAWGEGPPLLLLHGAHGSWKHWILNIDALARTRRVLAPDLPGYGESALPPRPGDGDSFAEAIAVGLRERVGRDAPIDVVGFSLGGVIGAHLAAIAPELVRRLILVDAGGLGGATGEAATLPVRNLQGEALRQAHRANLLSLMLREPASVDELAMFIQSTNVPRGRVNPISLVAPDRLVAVLPRVAAPIDAIWGEFDAPHPEPESHLAVIRRFWPGAQMRVIAGAGHWAMYERAEAFDTALAELLAHPPGR